VARHDNQQQKRNGIVNRRLWGSAGSAARRSTTWPFGFVGLWVTLYTRGTKVNFVFMTKVCSYCEIRGSSQRTFIPPGGFFCDVEMGHRCFHALVTKKILDSSYVVDDLT
jgi:hypothetical protein